MSRSFTSEMNELKIDMKNIAWKQRSQHWIDIRLIKCMEMKEENVMPHNGLFLMWTRECEEIQG